MSYPRSSAFIGGQIAFLSTLLSDCGVDLFRIDSQVDQCLRRFFRVEFAVARQLRKGRSGDRSRVHLEMTPQMFAVFAASESGATAAYIAQGEQRTAALLSASLMRCGMSARMVEPRDIGLIAEGTPLESTPVSVDVTALERFWNRYPILILPGFYGVDSDGSTALFGRAGSDLSALFLASELGASCRLLKDKWCGDTNVKQPPRSLKLWGSEAIALHITNAA